MVYTETQEPIKIRRTTFQNLKKSSVVAKCTLLKNKTQYLQ